MKKRFLLCFLLCLIVQAFGLAQTGGETPPTTDYNNVKMPESPSASAFNKVGETTINTATGIPNISIPLYTYELDGVQVPISISYNASGVKVGDLATCVGLGWSLVAGGQFSRTVRGKADEFDGWISAAPYGEPIDDDYYADYDPSDPVEWQHEMGGTPINNFKGLAKKHDHMPDQFSYSFLGHSGSYIHKYTDSGILKEKTDGVEFYEFSPTDDDFEAYDLSGNTYEFLDAEKSNNINAYATNDNLDSIDWEQQDGNIPATAWKLSKVTTKNGKQINFEYNSVDMEYTSSRAEEHTTIGYGCKVNSPKITNLGYTHITYSYNTQLLKKISSPDETIVVDFIYVTDNISKDSVWKVKLSKIIVTDLVNGTKKEFHFVYGRFAGDPRLRLDELFEVGYQNNQAVEKPHYIFTYNGTSMPDKGSFAQDFFGYYNGQSNNPSLVPNVYNGGTPFQGYFDAHSGDRDLHPNYVQNGVLTNIKYPTGGATHFIYQPNAINDRYCGGLRVSEIENVDETGTYNKKTYQYEMLNGFAWGDPANISLLRKNQGGATAYYSNYVSVPGTFPNIYKLGYFYGKVTVTSTDGSTSYKEENYYEENENAVHRYDYALKEKKYYKENQSQPIKIEEYQNDIIGQPETFRWNILGDMMCYQPPYFDASLGYNNVPKKVDYTGNYAYLPKDIYTTEFLGLNRKPVTTQKHINYDPSTLLKTREGIDTRKTREEDQNGVVSYPITQSSGEVTTTDYQYPWSDGINLSGLPKSLPISKVTYSNHFEGGSEPISGQYFKYDSNGNIKTTFQYNKGEGSNTTGSYIPNDYEKMTSFLFSNGKPVQTLDKYGVPTSYIWAFNGQKPVAKIKGRARSAINQSKLQAVENASYSGLPAALTALRSDASVASAMVTTYTYEPLKGVKTITDPKGDTITYFYDAFGRLEQVKDKQGRILSENEYNYGH